MYRFRCLATPGSASGAQPAASPSVRIDFESSQAPSLQRQALGHRLSRDRRQAPLHQPIDVGIRGLLQRLQTLPVLGVRREAAVAVADEALNLAPGQRRRAWVFGSGKYCFRTRSLRFWLSCVQSARSRALLSQRGARVTGQGQPSLLKMPYISNAVPVTTSSI